MISGVTWRITSDLSCVSDEVVTSAMGEADIVAIVRVGWVGSIGYLTIVRGTRRMVKRSILTEWIVTRDRLEKVEMNNQR